MAKYHIIEVTTDESTDAFQVQAFLSRIKGIAKVHVVTAQTILVYYYPLTIPAKRICKLIGTIGLKGHQKRLTNIVDIKEHHRL